MRQSSAPAALTSGTILAKRYRIEELIGSGGYASVYRATDMTLGYQRAVKEVTDPDPGVRKQFQLESELLINTKHPNVPHGYNLFEDRGRMYLVMEFISGKDLEELLNDSLTQRGRPLEEEQVLRWMLDICGALIEMHRLHVPIIHRDIKPANIKITPDARPVLIDFGLAKLQRAGRPTMTAAQGVSPGFAPPEQYMAKGRTDARTDVYGLGATFYACLTGKDPPEAPARLLAQTGAKGHHNGNLVPIRKANPKVSEATERLVLKALELSPAQRQQSAEQLEQDIAAALRALDGGTSGPRLGPPWTCPRCGTVNNATWGECSLCRAAKPSGLGGTSGRQRAVAPAPVIPDATGKRGTIGAMAALAGPGASAGTAQVPAAGRRRASPAQASPAQPGDAPTSLMEKRTGRQRAVAADARTATAQQSAVRPLTAQQPVVNDRPSIKAPVAPMPLPGRGTGQYPAAQAEQRTGKHATPSYTSEDVVPGLGGSQARSALALRQSAYGPAAAVEVTSEPTRAEGGVAVAELDARTAARSGAWLRFGETPLSGFGRWMLALAGIEVLWGAVVLAVGALVIFSRGHAFPMSQFVLAWAGIVLLGSLLGGQALARPVFRRGVTRGGRRVMQGIGLTLYALAVHAVAVWGATIFVNAQANPVLAVAAFLLFGVNVLVVGILSVINILG